MQFSNLLKKHNKFLKNLTKTQKWAFIGSLLSLVFLVGFFGFNYTWKEVIQDSIKFTNWGNFLIAFIFITYFINPRFRWFKNNQLIIFTSATINVVALGFWLILFPTFFVGLKDYVINYKESEAKVLTGTKLFIKVFWAFWNHSVTPFWFFIFMISHFRSKQNDCSNSVVKMKRLFLYFSIFLTFYILFSFVIFSFFFTNFFPSYGIFSNFNPNTPWKLRDGSTLFSAKILVPTLISMYVLGYLVIYYNWKLSIYFDTNLREKYLIKM